MGFRDGFDQAQAIRLPWRSLLAVQMGQAKRLVEEVGVERYTYGKGQERQKKNEHD